MLIRVNTAFSMQSACSTSQMKLYFPMGNLHLFGLIFSMVCLLGYILNPLTNSASQWFLYNMSICPIKTSSVNTGATRGNYGSKEEKEILMFIRHSFNLFFYPRHLTSTEKNVPVPILRNHGVFQIKVDDES